MNLVLNSLTLEGIASVILAIGLVSAYFLGSSLTGSSEAKSREVASQPVSQAQTETGKKKKKGKKEVAKIAEPVPQPRLPGGNENFSPTPAISEQDAEGPSAIVASLEAGAAAQENRVRVKKAKKKAKESATKQAQPMEAPINTPGTKTRAAKQKESAQQAIATQPEDESEWRVVGRSRKANTTANSQASFTTASATDAGSPKDHGSPTTTLGNLGERTVGDLAPVKSDASEDSEKPYLLRETHVDSADEPIPSSLAASHEFGGVSDVGANDSTEDDGFIPVKSKGRRRTQRTVSSQSTGGGVSGGVRASESLTKRQRQNKAKREAEKAAKSESEQQRQATLARHKRELENVRIEEMHKRGKQLSGGMSMSVGNSGKAEWD